MSTYLLVLVSSHLDERRMLLPEGERSELTESQGERCAFGLRQRYHCLLSVSLSILQYPGSANGWKPVRAGCCDASIVATTAMPSALLASALATVKKLNKIQVSMPSDLSPKAVRSSSNPLQRVFGRMSGQEISMGWNLELGVGLDPSRIT